MSTNLIGQVLNKQYRVEAFIASTPMSVVYRVWDQDRNVPLAMKVLHANLAEDPFIIDLLKREANALEKLKHPNIVLFYGLHQKEDFAFLLEAYVDGPTLKDILRQRKDQPTPILEALTYLKALSAALGYAHIHQVVHCDVKPGNVMVDRGGSIYLTDFGIVRHADSTVTQLGGAGSPAYMAPEQIRGERVNSATDVYALGVLLFEMLTGQLPFRGTEAGTESSGESTAERVIYAHLRLPPPNPCSIKPSIPADLARVILKALVKAPGERYQSAPEFFTAVCAALDIRPEDIPDRISMTSLPDAQSIVIEGKGIPIDDDKSNDRSRLRAGLAIVSAGVILVLLLWFIIIRPPIPPNGTQTADGMRNVAANTTGTPLAEVVAISTGTLTATPTLTPTNTPSPILIPTETSTPTQQPVVLLAWNTTASNYDRKGSRDSKGNPTNFLPENVTDGIEETAWRVPGDGIGEWILINFEHPVIVQKVGIIPGYAKIDAYDGTDRFQQNYVVQSILLEFSTGVQLTHRFEYRREMQFISLPGTKTENVRITILATYPPRLTDQRDFTAISEIKILGWGQ